MQTPKRVIINVITIMTFKFFLLWLKDLLWRELLLYLINLLLPTIFNYKVIIILYKTRSHKKSFSKRLESTAAKHNYFFTGWGNVKSFHIYIFIKVCTFPTFPSFTDNFILRLKSIFNIYLTVYRHFIRKVGWKILFQAHKNTLILTGH